MKKRVLATLLVAMMAMTVTAYAETETKEETAVEEAAEEEKADEKEDEKADDKKEADFGDLEAEFEPNKEYDKYTLVDYTIEDIDAQFVATVSAMDDGSKYEVHCNFYGDEQIFVADKDLKQLEDKTGFMATDGPIIIQNAIDADNWATIGEEKAEAGEADFGDLEAEFEANKDYDKYTLVDYTIEDIDAEFVATVSAMEDGSKYEVHCNFYGDEQIFVADKDLKQLEDKTGFMATDGPIIIQNAIDADNWAAIEK